MRFATLAAFVAATMLGCVDADLPDEPLAAESAAVTLPPAPTIVSTTIEGVSPVNGVYPLMVGRTYVARVRILRGRVVYAASVSPSNQTPPPVWAHVRNGGTQVQKFDAGADYRDFRFTVSPGDIGSFQLAFMMVDAPPPVGTGNAFNHDSGIAIGAYSPRTGITGVVSARTTGLPIAGATVRLDNGSPVVTGSDGRYHYDVAAGGPHRVSVSSAQHSPGMAVNVTVPAAGIRVDLPLEPAVPAVTGASSSYTRYIDYAYGRTVFHVLRVARQYNRVWLEQSLHPSGTLDTGAEVAARQQAIAVINGGYFAIDHGTWRPVGYYYSNAFYKPDPNPGSTLGPADQRSPVLGIDGWSTPGQAMRIVEKSNDIWNLPDWNPTSVGPLWDDNRNGNSDVSYALQAGPLIVRDGQSLILDSWYVARTAVGLADNGDLFMVVADGEGVNANQGSSLQELGEFFARVLGAHTAMNLDGGGSTQMSLRLGNGYRQVNTSTCECNHNADSRVLNFLTVYYP